MERKRRSLWGAISTSERADLLTDTEFLLYLLIIPHCFTREDSKYPTNIGLSTEPSVVKNSTNPGSKLREVKRSKEKRSTAPTGDEYSPEFEEFWEKYPRKREKRKADKNWNTLLKAGVDPQVLILCAGNYARECERDKVEIKFIKLPATFLGPSRPYEDCLTFTSGESATCSTCGHWEKGKCKERNEPTPADGYCKKWEAIAKGE